MVRPPDRTIKTAAPVSALAFAPSGDEIGASLKNGSFQVWSSAGQALRAWSSGEKGDDALAFSADGRLLAAARGEGIVALSDAKNGRPGRSFKAHKGPITGLSFSRDGSLLGTASDDGTIALWKTADGSLVFSFAGALGEAAAVAVSPAGDRVAGAWTDSDVRLVNAATGRLEHAITDLPMTAFALAFSSDGRLLACGCADGVVSLREAATGEKRGEPHRHAAPVGAVAFSRDSRLVASVGISMNPGTRESEVRVGPVPTGDASVESIGVTEWNAIAFTPDGTAHVVCVEKDTLKIWDVREPKPATKA